MVSISQEIKNKKLSPRDSILEAIISHIENNPNLTWVKMWNTFTPMNYSTKKRYSGINALLGLLTNYEYPYFMSFDQAKKLGLYVRKGATSDVVAFYSEIVKNKDTDEETSFKLLKYFNVFNVAHIEGLEIDSKYTYKPQAKIFDLETWLDEIYSRVPTLARIVGHGGDRAYFSPSRNVIQMPVVESFKTHNDYIATLLHELAHATGIILDRDMSGEFGTPKYAQEELIAELSSAMLINALGLEVEGMLENNSAYIRSWLRALKDDKNLIFRASSQAQRVFNLLMGENEDTE